MKKCFLSILLIFTINFVQAQNIELFGNSIVIANNGSNTPNSGDGTDFEDVVIGNSITHSFTIFNTESRNPGIQIQSITVNSGEYIITNNIHHIGVGDSGVFDVAFTPTSEGIQNAIVSIVVKRRNNRRTYTFNIRGNGIKDIMITQYYENGSADKIEVKNISNNIIENGSYYLGIYNNGTDTIGDPDTVIPLGRINIGEVKLIGNTNFIEGNDIIVISSSTGINCFFDRVDIIGDHSTWGVKTSFTKSACTSESPHLSFNLIDWIEIDTAKVNAADIRQNISLGTYNIGEIIWNGISWSDSSLPDLSRVVRIDGTYTANNGNIEACSLIVNSNLNFDNATTNSVVVYRDLTINGTFTIGDTESLVMYDNNAIIIGNIIKKESSTYRNNTYDFTYWSSSIVNASIGTVFSGVSSNRIFLFDQSQTNTTDPSHPDYWNTWIVASGNMDNGRAYATEGVSGTTGVHNILFTGTPNNGVINVDIFEWSDNDPDNDFNLIGNPYPSAINIETFFEVNSTIVDPTIYLWTHSTAISGGSSGDFISSDYATYNLTGGTGVGDGPVPDKNIGSSQGFFIRGISTGIAVFNNSMRIENANNQFYKTDKSKENVLDSDVKNRIWLNLTTNEGGFNQILIGFMDKATESIDRGYDALKIDNNNPISFYSVIENKKYVIQGLNNFSMNKSVSLGFDSKYSARTLTIGINRTEGILSEVDIYLLDNLLNTTHKLNQSDYQFDIEEKGEFKDRFSLQFKGSVLNVENVLKEEDMIISIIDNSFKVTAKQIVKTIRAYDMLGRMLIDSKPNKQDFYLDSDNVKKGSVLIINAVLDNGSRISKKIIKY